MTFRIYTICDDVAGQSGPVFQAVNDGVAVRQYRGLMLANPHLNPAEYTLWCIGVFDDVSDGGVCRLTSFPKSEKIDTDFDYVGGGEHE